MEDSKRQPASSQPLVAIVGQTASGKSALALKLAVKYKGEIIAADSRTIYRGMDIGTAKPSRDDQAKTKHYGLNLIEPNETFSAAQFKQYAQEAIRDIQNRGKLPIVVGGTGLYIDGLLYDFQFGGPANPNLRHELDMMSLEELQKEAVQIGIGEDAIDFKNRRHLSRVIERGGIIGSRRALSSRVLMLGIEVDKEILDKRIEVRVEQMLDLGFEKEVQKLLTNFGSNAPGLLTPGYKEFTQYLDGNIDFIEAKTGIISSHKKLAKRQKTWFKRNKDIVWVQSFEQADKLVSSFLHKFDTMG